jgi:Zn-dependent metalloprotease
MHHDPRSYRHATCCVLPPHILRNVAQNGTPQQRQRALRTLAADQTLRALRGTQLMRRRGPGQTISTQPEGQKQRTVCDAAHSQNLPGEVVRSERTGASKDVSVNEAFDGLGATFDFFWRAFERRSIDDEGLPLDASVHFGQEYDNAFWDGKQMVFGDGDGELFNRFTVSLDVIGHELAHGVTEDEGPLVYFSEAGALNESMSDVFGSLVKQHVQKQTAAQADWLIGGGLLAKGVKGVALRSMKEPGTAFDDPVLGKDPQPGHMENFVNTFEDNGGVHINSGIPNRAFYLAATALGGNAWEKAGRIWYETLRDSRLRPNTGFRRFARLTVATAQRLFGTASSESKAVVDAWNQVGIKLVF